MTHGECCDALLRAARRFGRSEITVQEWFAEVQRVFDLRYADATAPLDVRIGGQTTSCPPSRTSNALDTPLPSAARIPALAGDHAASAA